MKIYENEGIFSSKYNFLETLYKTALEKQQKQGDLKVMIRELEEKHDREKLESQSQFREYKQQVNDNEK